MAVDATTSATSATGTSTTTSSSTSTAASKATLNYDNFLKLLIAQMKTQDPTDPMKASDQIAQLATFSQVEQTVQTNTKLDTLLSSQTLTQASSYVGKYMTSADGTVQGTVASVKVYSDGMVATTTEGKSILVQTGITISNPSSESSSS